MHHVPERHAIPRAQALAERAFATVERFLHIEAVSGIVLVVAAVIALAWANSPYAASYEALWHTPLSVGIGNFVFSQSLHFWINDALMAVFFLVVGMEIRREMHEGALSDLRQAALPVGAAVGGVIAPALIYSALNSPPSQQLGWAVPTATDIAFAVGVLALLGRAVPSGIRVFLLALAIIDDIIAILIIALFYSSGLDFTGFAIAALGIVLVLGLQRIGIGSAFGYVLPGALLWIGLLKAGIHPTLAGVVLGLLTPVRSTPMREKPREVVTRVAQDLSQDEDYRAEQLAKPARQLRLAQRELVPPVVRVQMALHPWVAFLIMPLFALANAGVSLGGLELDAAGPQHVLIGVALALVVGKPLGVVAVSALMVRLGLGRLPPGVSWSGIVLVGLLAGIGFTMAIFIALLAFKDAQLLSAAKLGVLVGSLVAAVIGVAWGMVFLRRQKG
ncbi:Na+/H+ antiporter NhaA [Tahibacter harae]|uniref:Na(+)/H(+) antiporter NhaA n=1 Tax=Tahibacter harae TaxID=2963937 RepID=A0ABT1QMZ9_9GAMM|nr:Na+/H+ antiporter NhaA [Tahibacter harae]MCQ4163916.1 Na+/H+ antiporter NhaA [Tahibacter harae]